MDIEKIEKAFGLVLENIMAIQAELLTDFYDAFVEQNAAYLGALEFASLTKENNDKVRSMNLTKSEWQKLFQFVLLQGSRVSPMQANHNLTPDSIGFIFNFIIEELHKERKIRLLEFGSGTGNLAETLLVHMQKEVDYVGFEVDDLLLDLSASMSEVMGTEASFLQIDAVKPQPLEPVDVVMSDLPVGYYPDDETASHFQVHDKSEHTYVHHLMIEQSFKYLKESGFALFLAPDNLLTSAQSEFLKAWIKEHAHVAAVITLPSSLFKGAGKSIYLLSKNQTNTPTFVYPLSDLADRSILQEFMSEFVKNVKIWPKTLAVNAGSSSMKWQMYEMPEEKVLAKGLIERIGLKDSVTTVKFNDQKEERVLDIVDHTQAVHILLEDLKRFHIVEEFPEITGVGHRVVAGGELFKKSTLIDQEVLKQIEELSPLAPLHNPANAAGIKAFLELLPEATAVAVFDTAFHTTMPEKAFRYPLPKKYYTENAVRKYGAHGTSHMFVAQEAAKMLGKDIKDTKIITAHIGNGGSITAVKGGKSIDTSMGFTPLAGIMMGTRTGDMAPSVFPYLIANDDSLKDAQDVVNMMNKESGLFGVSGLSSDMREIITARDAGDTDAALAFEMYVDRIQKFIGQYLAVLNGADAIVFTAGVGENSAPVREGVLKGLSWFGIDVDFSKNVFGFEGEMSTPESRVKVFVIPTDEELVIARDVEAAKAK